MADERVGMWGVMKGFVKQLAGMMLGGLFLSGMLSCSSVTLPEPMPSNVSVEEREPLEGAWENGEGALQIKFDKKGMGWLAFVEWDEDAQKFQARQMKFALTKIGSEYYVTTALEEENEGGRYGLGQCLVHDGNLIFWTADTDAFVKLVEGKVLNGVVKKEKYGAHVELEITGSAMMDFLAKADTKSLFDYQHPMVLRKLAK